MGRIRPVLLAIESQDGPIQDSAATDSLGQALERLGESVTETGQMVIGGEWSALADRTAALGAQMIESILPNLVSAVFVGGIFYLLFRGFRKVVRRLLSRSRRVSAGLEALLMRTLNVLGVTFIFVLFLSQLGLNVAALIAGLGIAGIALGFAAKDTLENFIAGVTILLDRPFSVGDYVEIEGTYGQVVEITLRSTRIRTLGNRMLVAPNLLMINQSLKNMSDPGRRIGLRVDVPFGIAYKEKPAEAREVVLGLTDGDDRLRREPNPDVVVVGLNDSSVDMMLRMYVEDPGDEYAVRFDYTERVREALRDAEIEIPFPHLQVFIDEAKAFRTTDGGTLALAEEGS